MIPRDQPPDSLLSSTIFLSAEEATAGVHTDHNPLETDRTAEVPLISRSVFLKLPLQQNTRMGWVADVYLRIMDFFFSLCGTTEG